MTVEKITSNLELVIFYMNLHLLCDFWYSKGVPFVIIYKTNQCIKIEMICKEVMIGVRMRIDIKRR